jgi:diguanylate cyclase (GGDEF)-like protein
VLMLFGIALRFRTIVTRLARRDVLTQLPNRLAANERLQTEFLRMKRSKSVYAVLMIDIDHFKQVNDTYGHAVGDQVLQRVAATMQAALRESDFCARFGGEEFLALLPATDLSAAYQVAEKLRQAVQASPDPTAGRLSVSMGLGLSNPEQANVDIAVRDADEALYRAKSGGRNQVQMAQGLLSQVKTGDTCRPLANTTLKSSPPGRYGVS